MKLRVKHFHEEYYGIQRKWFGLVWIWLTRAIVFDSYFISTRYHPLLFRSFEGAKKRALELFVPGAMESFILEQDRLWASAEQNFKKQRESRKRIMVLNDNSRKT